MSLDKNRGGKNYNRCSTKPTTRTKKVLLLLPASSRYIFFSFRSGPINHSHRLFSSPQQKKVLFQDRQNEKNLFSVRCEKVKLCLYHSKIHRKKLGGSGGNILVPLIEMKSKFRIFVFLSQSRKWLEKEGIEIMEDHRHIVIMRWWWWWSSLSLCGFSTQRGMMGREREKKKG